MDKFSNWAWGAVIGPIIGFLCIDIIRFRRNISEKYVRKDDYVRELGELKQDIKDMHKDVKADLVRIWDKVGK